jgi:6,7-dimethyl-8-ribityllumazine synthase
VITVSGAYELPFAAKSAIVNSSKADRVDAVIALGVLIKGDTPHFEYICEGVSQGIMNVGLQTGTPVVFGVLTCLTEKQAEQRAGLASPGHNHGEDWGTAAVEMAKLKFLVAKL